ncbi:MAG: ThiF family adenylyltransferase [Burkholderiales bacterium]
MNSPQAFPSNAEEFYRLRDDRTNLYGVDGEYHAKAVRVTASPAVLRTLSGQILLVVSVNLLARWCRQVVLAIDDHPLHAQLGPAGFLLAHVLASMRDADPFGEFTVGGDERSCDLHLHIGDGCRHTAVPTTVISASGWYAAVRRASEPALAAGSANRIGAVAAAILGGAQVFRDALGRGELYGKGFLFDAFSGRPVSEQIQRSWEEQDSCSDLGRLLMVGAGSVGSAAAYFIRLLGLPGSMRVVDGDVGKVENISRSPILGRRLHGCGKASAVQEALSGGALDIEAEDAWWRESKSTSLAGYDIIIPVANEQDIRWEIQNGCPPLMVHASTGRNWNVNFGRHIPGVDDCLADRFVGFEDKPVFTCASGKLADNPKAGVDASLPFLSFFAGFLIATDLARLGVEGYPHTTNFANYSFLKNRFMPQLYPETPRDECICHSQARGFWRFRKHTRYSHLSPSSWT